jgi:hypothetical protein
LPIRTAIWKVGSSPEPLIESALAKEQTLEKMIVAAPRLLSEEWMLIGQQEDTGFGGRIDLLAIAPDGSLVLIELKRERTPRDVVAQALDYASWVGKLRADEIAKIYERFAPTRSLEADFQQRFGLKLDEDMLNQNHEIVIVASALDESSERIVNYLSERNISINILCFQIFALAGEQLLSRSWLLDPVRSQVSSSGTTDSDAEPWNGEFYCSFGEGDSRSWEDALKYGFVCGGGGVWYSRTLGLLRPGDRIWVKVPNMGFVGVGRVTGQITPALAFTVKRADGSAASILDVASGGTYHREFAADMERCEYFVAVDWLQTLPVNQAVWEIGLFGNQNTVCKPTTPKWRFTVDRLKLRFPQFDQPATAKALL